jgi:hypothetical protein
MAKLGGCLLHLASLVVKRHTLGSELLFLGLLSASAGAMPGCYTQGFAPVSFVFMHTMLFCL